jgi:hypothetical protein
MPKTSPDLEAFSNRADLVFVITKFNTIEAHLTDILTKAIEAPKKSENFVRDILFNNAIVSFSSKVQLFLHLRATYNWPKVDAQDFHRFMSIRNQFAHCNPRHHVFMKKIVKNHQPSNVKVKLMLESLSNKGQIVPVESSQALQEYTEIYDRLQDYLLTVSKLV